MIPIHGFSGDSNLAQEGMLLNTFLMTAGENGLLPLHLLH
jgi:hypothetical protein